MPNELVVSEALPPATQLPVLKDEFLAIIASAVRDPSVDVQKMQALLDMKERIDAQRAKVAYMEAFNAAQSEMRPIVKSAENKHTGTKFALMEKIDAEIKPIYTAHGFSLSFSPEDCPKDKHVRIVCDVAHRAGHNKTYGPLDVHVDDVGAKGNATKTPIQGQGSSFTYARRYMKLLVFDLTLTEEDNDGNGRLTDEQHGTLCNLIEACNLTERALKNILGIAGVETVDQISPHSYDAIVQTLKDKLNAKHRGQA